MEWSSGICDCCETTACAQACCCPCLVFMWNVQLMEQKGFENIPVVGVCTGYAPVCACALYATGMLGGFVGGNTAASYAHPAAYVANSAGCLPAFLHGLIRHTIRKQNKIHGNVCDSEWGDCCCALWCYSCALAQENRMLEKMGDISEKTNSMAPLLHV